MPALMQVLTDELRSPYQQADPTKCLSTAFMSMYLLAGDAGARSASSHCDSAAVRKRSHAGGKDRAPRAEAARALERAVMGGHDRTLFYVMLTNGHMPRPGGGPVGKFPGHVFVIERLPATAPGGAPSSRFNLYQSYIAQYDLAGTIERRALSHGRKQMGALLSGLARMLDQREGVWDAKATAFWRRLTGVGAPHFEGCSFGDDALLPCHYAVRTDRCVATLTEVVARKLRELDALPRELDAEVYGSMAAYDLRNDTRPRPDGRVPLLTNAQVRAELTALLAKLE